MQIIITSKLISEKILNFVYNLKINRNYIKTSLILYLFYIFLYILKKSLWITFIGKEQCVLDINQRSNCFYIKIIIKMIISYQNSKDMDWWYWINKSFSIWPRVDISRTANACDMLSSRLYNFDIRKMSNNI